MQELLYLIPALGQIRDFLELGGDVLLFISLLTLVMWAFAIERLIFFFTGYRALAAQARKAWDQRTDRTSWQAHRIREQWVSQVRQALERHLGLISACVALCPLLGLLGTVTGMVEVFEVMAISGSGNPRSMAAGVSKATIPTMAGMVAALSGIAISAFLQQWAKRESARIAQTLVLEHPSTATSGPKG